MSQGNGLSLASRKAASYDLLLGLVTLIGISQPIIAQALPLFGSRPMNPIAATIAHWERGPVIMMLIAVPALLFGSLLMKELAPPAWFLYGIWTALIFVVGLPIDPYAAWQYAIYGIVGFGISAATWKVLR